MKQEIIYVTILVAAISFAAGYLIGHDRLNIQECERFLDLEASDTIGETLQKQSYQAPKF